MSVTVPAALRHAVSDDDAGPGWLAGLDGLVVRAVQRWGLVVSQPFETGMAAWTAPATTATGIDVVLKLSFPHPEARDEAAALAAWNGVGAVELLGADPEDQALLLRRLQPGSTLRDAALPIEHHLTIGAELLRRMATVRVPPGEPFQDLVEVAGTLATDSDERIARTLPQAPYPTDAGLCGHGVDLLRTLPGSAEQCGLAHGDLNPGNILRQGGSPSPPKTPRTSGSPSIRSPSTATWTGPVPGRAPPSCSAGERLSEPALGLGSRRTAHPLHSAGRPRAVVPSPRRRTS